MPEHKRGKVSAGSRSKASSRTAAKVVSAKPAKRSVAAAKPVAKLVVPVVAAKPETKRAATGAAKVVATKAVAVKAQAKLADKTSAVKPVAKRPEKAQAAKTAATAKTVLKPVKKRGRADLVAEAAVRPLAAEEVAETIPTQETEVSAERLARLHETLDRAFDPAMGHSTEESVGGFQMEHWSSEVAFEPVAVPWLSGHAVDDVTEEVVLSPAVEVAIEEQTVESSDGSSITGSASMHEAAGVPAEADPAEIPVVAETAVERRGTDSPDWPQVDRRVRSVSLLERRLANPTAKNRRASDVAAQKRAAGAAAKDAKSKSAVSVEDIVGAVDVPIESNVVDATPIPPAERRVENRRATDRGEGLESEFRAREQQNLFNETAVWMRKGGTALIGLNVLIIVAVLVLWRVHPSQLPDMKEMQKASAAQIAEMRRVTAASEMAAYAACLGSQTARSLLLEMKAGGTEQRVAVVRNGMRVVGDTEGETPQIEFDLEKTTSMNVHVPVLFHVGIRNVGNGSALNAKVWGEVKVLDAAKDPEFKYDEVALTKRSLSPKEPAAKVVLYTTDAGMVVPLKEAEFQQVNTGAAYIVTYGRMVYEDVSGVKHWAEFCHYITEPAGVKSHAGKCSAYNGSGVVEGTEKLSAPKQQRPMNASMTLPEIACVLPKE